MTVSAIDFAFKNAREASGLTQNELAKKLGVTRQTVITREKNPTLMNAVQMRAWYETMNEDGRKILDLAGASFFKQV